MRDLKNNIAAVKAVEIAAISSSATKAGGLLDVSQFTKLCFLLITGHAYTDGTYTLLVQEGDASDGSDLATVDSSLLLKDSNAGALSAADGIARVGYIGTKKYVKASIVSTSVTTGAVAGVIAVEADALYGPVAD